MSLECQSKLNRLLVLGKKNGLFFSNWLRKNGYSDQLIRKYRQSGWLATLDKGVMYRTGSDLAAAVCEVNVVNTFNSRIFFKEDLFFISKFDLEVFNTRNKLQTSL